MMTFGSISALLTFVTEVWSQKTHSLPCPYGVLVSDDRLQLLLPLLFDQNFRGIRFEVIYGVLGFFDLLLFSRN
jgi:hypothetical protein